MIQMIHITRMKGPKCSACDTDLFFMTLDKKRTQKSDLFKQTALVLVLDLMCDMNENAQILSWVVFSQRVCAYQHCRLHHHQKKTMEKGNCSSSDNIQRKDEELDVLLDINCYQNTIMFGTTPNKYSSV